MSDGNDLRDSRESGGDGSDRRQFLKYIGATGSAAGIAGCVGEDGGSSPTATQSATEAGTEGALDGTQTASETEEEQIPKGGTFIDSTNSTASGLNTFRFGDGATGDRVAQVLDGSFLRKSPEYSDILPLWFEEFNVADSLTEIEYKLRPNLEYGGDYGQLTVDDYLYNVENVWTQDWASFTYSYRYEVDGKPIEFEKVDDLTVKAKIDEPRPFWPYNEPLGVGYPIPEEILKPYVEAEDAEGLAQDDEVRLAQFNGNLGPWDLKRWEQQSVYEFERSDDYYLRKWAKEDDRVPNAYAEAPFFDERHVQYFKKPTTARQALKSDEVDVASVPSTKVSTFKEKDDLTLYENPFVSYSAYLGINQRANGWDQLRNKKVRHALSHIYHNEFVADQIDKGRAGVQDTLHPAWGPYYPDDVKSFSGSLDKARTLLKEGTSSDYGYSGDTFVDGNGEQVELKLIYTSGKIDDLKAAYLKKRLNKVGIKLQQETTSWTALLTNYFTTSNPAEGVAKEDIGYGEENTRPSRYNYGPADEAVSSESWDLMNSLGFSYGPLDPAGTVTALFGEQESFNAYGFEPDRDLTEMRQNAATAESREAAKGTISEMLGYLAEERPVVFESNPKSYTAYRKKVDGMPKSPAASYFTDQNHDVMYFSDGVSGR